MSLPTRDPDDDLDRRAPESPAELRRRLRRAYALLEEAEASPSSVAVLMRAHGHLSGTLRRLGQLIASSGHAPQRIEDVPEDGPTTRFASAPTRID